MSRHVVVFAMGVLFMGRILHAGQNIVNIPRGAKASVEGTVTRATTGQPLRGARISLLKKESNGPESERVLVPVTTDNQGQFHIFGIQPGEYRIAAERDGFIRQEYGQRTPAGRGIARSEERRVG